jgi:hypothetical protein
MRAKHVEGVGPGQRNRPGVSTESTRRISMEPTGKCFCGCGQETSRQAYFVVTHDRRAESKVIKAEYGSIAAFVVAHGYGPDYPDGGGPRSRGQ